MFIFQSFFKLAYLFGSTRSLLQHSESSIFIWAWEFLVMAYGIKFPSQGLNSGLLHWELGFLATGSPGNSLSSFTLKSETLFHTKYLAQCLLCICSFH